MNITKGEKLAFALKWLPTSAFRCRRIYLNTLKKITDSNLHA